VALMLRHHVGSGRRGPIGNEWARAYRTVANGTHTCVVELRRPGGTRGVFDPVTGTWGTTAAEAYYTGKARVQMISDSDLKRISADQQISALFYRVSLDHNVVGTELGDRVTVLSIDDNGDPDLVGRTLKVDTIVRASLHWERQLVCVDELEKAVT
jgi:hypothetical protein